MTNQEWAILDALNIAATIHRNRHGFGATAAQIAAVLNEDERLAEDYQPALLRLNGRQVGYHLSVMAGTRDGPWRFKRDPGEGGRPLVERVPPGCPRFRLARAGLDALCA